MCIETQKRKCIYFNMTLNRILRECEMQGQWKSFRGLEKSWEELQLCAMWGYATRLSETNHNFFYVVDDADSLVLGSQTFVMLWGPRIASLQRFVVGLHISSMTTCWFQFWVPHFCRHQKWSHRLNSRLSQPSCNRHKFGSCGDKVQKFVPLQLFH